MKKIHPKVKALEWSQQVSHYNPIEIFSDAQWQVTPQSEVWYGLMSNPSETLWLSLIPARMKKFQSKIMALEWSQHYLSIFKMLKGSLLHKSDGIGQKFTLVQAFIIVFVTSKNEEDPSKIEGTRVVTTFLQLYVNGDFPDAQWQLNPQSLVGSCRILNPSENLWFSSLPARIKKNLSKMKELE